MKMDRISFLPNSILCNILSYLPTEEAVSTSILSSRWRQVCKELQVFDIDDTPFRSGLEWEARFVSYVNAILTQRNADYPIQKFRLTCNKVSKSLLLTWLNAVIGPHLQELYLNIDLPIKLPEAILTCPSLKSLILKRDSFLDSYPKFSNVYLPSLKNLELDIVYMDPSKLLSGCPVLENFKLILQVHDNSCVALIPTMQQMPRTLKSLIIEDNTFFNGVSHRLILIDTPSLEYLHIKVMTLLNSKLEFSFSNFINIVEAHLDLLHDCIYHVGWVPHLLHALRETKLLALKGYSTLCLFSAPAFEFPEFHRLLNLELDVPCFSINFLLNFLHSSHVLEALVINDISKEKYFHLVEYDGPAPPTMVPNCVTSHLKSFEFRGYEDSVDKREFIAYLLQRGLALEIVTIHLNYVFNQETKYDIVRELSAIPRGSTTCQLNFIDQNAVEHG
ncbi:FBD-associated F-box protein At5g56370-like [Arachis duranensis]|uniref:FBD-associated F-box protein At5g56370-like n=1 Tax=Arachis duranensis TaxID=130453 RepID=A0A6P4C424_ARADU|nr:FBD-associated F-box protein At5g56370-like [Arachis duranensis]